MVLKMVVAETRLAIEVVGIGCSWRRDSKELKMICRFGLSSRVNPLAEMGRLAEMLVGDTAWPHYKSESRMDH